MLASPSTRAVIFSLLLVAATLVFYNPIGRNRFVEFDDASYVVDNPQVQQGLTWNTVKWSFTTFREGNWHPLTWLSHALDYQLFGPNPVGHHYTNLLLHAANAVLLFLLLWRATGSLGASGIVAALFAFHPINVESVAWAAERKNVLSMFFCLFALYAYEGYVRRGRRELYWAVVILFALGLMAKPQIVTLPFVLLLWDYWPLERLDPAQGGDGAKFKRSFSFLVWEKWPLFVLAAADSVVTVVAQHAGNTVRNFSEVSISTRLGNVFVSYARYFGKIGWPVRLAPLYPRPASGVPIWRVIAAVALLLAVTALVLRFRKHRYLVVGWFWFLGTLVPMIGLITVGEQAMADRYAYLPAVGLFIAIVWAGAGIANKRKLLRWSFAGSMSVVLLGLGFLTSRQIAQWHDEETLWRYALSVTDDNYVAHNYLAIALAKAGRDEEALVHFRAARQLHSYPPNQIVKLAYYELRIGHPELALEECRAALAATSDPLVRQAAFTQEGRALLELHRYEEAAASYGEALSVESRNEEALAGSGLLALRAGKFAQSAEQFSRLVQLDPGDVNLLLLAQALRRAGRSGEANRVVAQAQQRSANLAGAEETVRNYLGMVGVKAE